MNQRLINFLISPWVVALPVSMLAFIVHPVWYGYFPIYYASFLLFIVLIQRLSEIRKKRGDELRYRLIMLELNSIKSRLNPHFVFNVMSTLSNLVLKDEKNRAYECITLFSGFLRQAFENSGMLVIPLKDELSLVEKYIKLQWIRFSGCFDFNIKVDDQVNFSRRIPKALILTFVERAVKHGLFHKQRNGLLDVKVTVEEKNTVISIEDNGADTGQVEKNTDRKLRMALFTMEETLEILNAINKRKIIYRIEPVLDNRKAHAGNRVLIRIPENYKTEISYMVNKSHPER